MRIIKRGEMDDTNSIPRKLSPEDEECKRKLLEPLDENQMRLFRMQLHVRLLPLFIVPPTICAGIVGSMINGQADMPKDAVGILVAFTVSLFFAALFSIAAAGLLVKIETKKSAELNWSNVCFVIFSLNSISFTGYFVLLWIIFNLASIKLGNALLTFVAFVFMTISMLSSLYFLRKKFRLSRKRAQ